jgi:salicylate 5-hydroxylase large subunit
MSTAARGEWPEGGATATPYWAYTDENIYEQELERIWQGPHWLYCGLEAELPEVGSYRTLTLGERPVIMVRSGAAPGEISVLENSCAHRGTKICWSRGGRVEELTCPYHQWSYQLTGELTGVPFRRGIRGEGGMPKDFNPRDHNLRRLAVEVVNGLVWASFGEQVPDFRTYLGAKLFGYYERLFSGRKLRVIGYNRQRINGNWKLMLENNKDPYHAALLHVFFATFGLFRPDQKSALEMDETGRHACLMSVRNEGGNNDMAGVLSGFDQTLKLQDPRIIQAVKEFPGEETVSAITVFPSVILLQQVNSIQARQIVPRGPGCFDFMWTHIGFEDDDEEMRGRRIRHANLFGPSGFVSADDSEVIRKAQEGFVRRTRDATALNLMGGRTVESSSSMATETAIRGMYQYYRQVMEL